MGNFFSPLEHKVETPGDVAVELRKLSDEVRASPSVTDARLKVVRFLTRPDVRETLGDTRIEWMRRDLQKATDVDSVNVFISNTTRVLEKDDMARTASAAWQGVAKHIAGVEMDTGHLRSHGPIVGKRKKRKGREVVRQTTQDIVKEMPPEVKLRENDELATLWREMTPEGRAAAARKAGFTDAEAKELCRLAWEGLDPSIKADLAWVLKAPPEHLPRERFLAPMIPFGAASAGGAGYWGPSEEAFPGQLPATGVVEGIAMADWDKMSERERIGALHATFVMSPRQVGELVNLSWEELPPSVRNGLERYGKRGQSEAEDEPEEDPQYDDIRRALEEKIQSMADAHAAEAWSTPTDDMIDQFGKDVWVKADFGDWTAVNGDLVFPDQPTPNPPEGFELTDFGGRVPTTEEEIQVKSAVDAVAWEMKIPFEKVQAVADGEGYGELTYVSSSGDVEVWAKPQEEKEKVEPKVRRRPPFLSPSKRKAINKRLSDISRQFWNSMWDATDAIHKVLKDNGIEPEDYVITGEPEGRKTIRILMAGEEIGNSMLVLSWHRFEATGRYEVNTYVS